MVQRLIGFEAPGGLHRSPIRQDTNTVIKRGGLDLVLVEKKDGPTERSLCGAVEDSPRGVPEWDWGPFYPGGTTQAKVADATMAGKLQLWAAMGRPCASDFKADAFLAKRPQYGWMKGLLRDMKSEPWTVFTAGMTAGETR